MRFCGQYTQARARKLRGKRAPFITYGYSKDHHSDLKQLLFILTTSDDGGIPVQFRCEHGNINDTRTHEHQVASYVNVGIGKQNRANHVARELKIMTLENFRIFSRRF